MLRVGTAIRRKRDGARGRIASINSDVRPTLYVVVGAAKGVYRRGAIHRDAVLYIGETGYSPYGSHRA